MRAIELLSPAKNFETGIAAIHAGADAVYIGTEKFSARREASNSIADIRKLIRYAHIYRAKVYLALNTILYDHELTEACRFIHQLYESGIDAVIVQDMGLLQMDLPPVALFASTQTDNRNIVKIKFLENAGFKRVILARELTLSEIKKIRQETTLELEFFVHGALCVCYSGQCYMGYAINGRSANRGECPQPCRMAYDLTDKEDKILLKNQHLLSLKDLDLSAHINELIDAGISSFKIEGRLKDKEYVKNITAFYRTKIDSVLNGNKSLKRPSAGKSALSFVPDPSKTFSRDKTEYFINGRQKNLNTPFSPKSTGEFLGYARNVKNNSFQLSSQEKINNNDGLCFIDRNNKMQGLKVNHTQGERIFVNRLNGLTNDTPVYRNYNHEFKTLIGNPESALRKIAVDLELTEAPDGFFLTATDETGIKVSHVLKTEKLQARNIEKAFLSLSAQLKKSGNIYFDIRNSIINLSGNFFLPISAVNRLRRETLEKLENKILETTMPEPNKRIEKIVLPEKLPNDYRANVSNNMARKFYQNLGIEIKEPAMETDKITHGRELMRTRYCILYEKNMCLKTDRNKTKMFHFPLYLNNNGKKYLLQFDCVQCEMVILNG